MVGAVSHLNASGCCLGYCRGFKSDIVVKKGGIVIVANDDAFTAEGIVRGECCSQLCGGARWKLCKHVLPGYAGDVEVFSASRVYCSIEDRLSKVHEFGPVTSPCKRDIFVHGLSTWTDRLIVTRHYPGRSALEDGEL